MPTVMFFPRVCLDYEPDDINLISLGQPDDTLDFLSRFKDPLRLGFDDVEQDLGPGYVMFDYLMGLKLLDWVKRLPPHSDIAVHCYAGISRSAAVARFLVNVYGYTLRHNELSLNDWSKYNTHVYRTLEIVNLDMKFRIAKK